MMLMSSHAVKQNGLIVLESSHKGWREDTLANIDYCNPRVITQPHLLMAAVAQRRVFKVQYSKRSCRCGPVDA